MQGEQGRHWVARSLDASVLINDGKSGTIDTVLKATQGWKKDLRHPHPKTPGKAQLLNDEEPAGFKLSQGLRTPQL
jgi:hypothetical protein